MATFFGKWLQLHQLLKKVAYLGRFSLPKLELQKEKKTSRKEACTLYYQSEVSILGPVGYGPTTLPLRHSDIVVDIEIFILYSMSDLNLFFTVHSFLCLFWAF